MPLVELELLAFHEHTTSPPVFRGFVLVNLKSSVSCFVDHCLSLWPFHCGHCMFCPLIYGFWLPKLVSSFFSHTKHIFSAEKIDCDGTSETRHFNILNIKQYEQIFFYLFFAYFQNCDWVLAIFTWFTRWVYLNIGSNGFNLIFGV